MSVASRSHVLATLKHYFGFDTLRPLQEEALRAALRGQDSLLVMPTGGGKSLCYQLPPLLTESLTVVVSPLIALMKDQVDGLRLAGYPAAALNSSISADDARETLSQLDAGTLRLLFLAPERLLTPAMLSRLARYSDSSTPSLRASVPSSLSFAIDEAHCISQWGHDFRPEYRRLAELRETFPAAPIHAFTATATVRVQSDILEQLQLRDPALLIAPFDRPNLLYRVVPRSRADQQCAEIIQRHQKGEAAGAAIIYCISRRNTEDLAAALRAKGIEAQAYHAGLDARERRGIQDDFANERLDVVVATVAFGMGIDRSNVRCVIHAAMPKSIEHYQQETGRAGRDGLPAECILLYSPGDAAKWRQILTTAAAETGADESLKVQLALLDRMQRFAASSACRHRALAEYFGQPYEPPTIDIPFGSQVPAGDAPGGAGFPARQSCNACDTCLNELAPAGDSTTIARKILSCVARVNQQGYPFGPAHIAHILRGRETARIIHYRHHQLSTFGLLRETPRHAILSYIDQLVSQGALALAPGSFPTLSLTEQSIPILRGHREVQLLEPADTPAYRDARSIRSRQKPAETARSPLSPADTEMFESLRALRLRIAREHAVPPWLIFPDTVLREMARQRPTTPEALRAIPGVGDRKLADFGRTFAEHIAGHASNQVTGP
ncbi:MAG: RecQ family ATP-dependent DNA helicase [Phycisphaerales bacterium]